MPRQDAFAMRSFLFARRSRVVLMGLAIVGGLVWIAAHILAEEHAVRAGRIADARAWAIDGPPCPQITEAEFLGNHHKGPRRFDYEGVSFFRRYGHVTCSPVYEHGGTSKRFHPVCQFTSPGDLLIRTPKGEWFYRVGPGRPATVSVPGQEARCVLAARITIANFNAAP